MNDSREHILTVALGLFLQKSFKEVTMQEIVRKTKLSKGAFYHYFKSKEQLFLEILNSYFVDSMMVDYSKCSQDSLLQFGRDLIAEMEKKIQPSDKKGKGPFNNNVNYFFLIFDGMKLFPEFRKKMLKAQEVELNTWKKIVRRARDNGEIKSEMTDEQIAKLFVYISDGVGMHLILENKIDKMKQEFVAIMDGLYNQLKA